MEYGRVYQTNSVDYIKSVQGIPCSALQNKCLQFRATSEALYVSKNQIQNLTYFASVCFLRYFFDFIATFIGRSNLTFLLITLLPNHQIP